MKTFLNSPQSLLVLAALLLPVLPTSVATSALAYQLGAVDMSTLMQALGLVALLTITTCFWLGNRLLSTSSSNAWPAQHVVRSRSGAVTGEEAETVARHQHEFAFKLFTK